MCSSGNIPAQATAKSVMASAKRLIEVRHCCRNSSKIAEISVPAWPMPIHHNKLHGDQRAGVPDPNPPQKMEKGEPPADGDINAPDAHTFDEQIANGEIQQHQQREGNRKTENPALGRAASEHDRTDLVGDS